MTKKIYIRPEVQVSSVTVEAGILATSGARLMEVHKYESEQW